MKKRASIVRATLTVLLLTLSRSAAQETAPTPELPPPAGLSPASDKEETGALTDMLPGFVDPLLLPAEKEPSGEEQSVSLFPEELWSGDHTPVPGPDAPGAEGVSVASGDTPVLQDIWASTFGPAPPPPLHDPQQLLTPAQRAELTALVAQSLNARGTFLTSVVVVPAGEQIPVALHPPELLQQWYGSRMGVLVIYFLGQPDRTQAFFSPSVRQGYRSEDLRQVMDFGVRESARMTAPVAQLQRFCYKTAIRLDRLHRRGVVSPTDEPGPVAAVAPAVPDTGLWWAFAIGVQAAGLAVAAVWWWRRRRTEPGHDGAPIYLPAQDFVARLGAPHAGGGGAVMPFGALPRG